MNLRVVRQGTGERVGFFRATIRAWLKIFTGLFSFFFMPITRRHQALHDVATDCAVVIHDLGEAENHHFVQEEDDSGAVGIGRARRLGIILLYWILTFSVTAWAFARILSACRGSNVCADDGLFYDIAGLVNIVLLGSIMVLGWKGMLPGARLNTAESHDQIIAGRYTRSGPN